MAATYDIGTDPNPPIIQGDTFQLPFTVTDVWVAGALTIRGQLRTSYTDAADVPFTCAVLSRNAATGTTPATVSCMATLSATDTAAMSAGSYVYDIEIEDTAGFVLKPLRGKAKVLPEVTR